VTKGEKIMMIYRLKRWDLPKGKLKRKEDSMKGAKREVEEECNIKVEVKDKIGATWHTYTQKGKKILKKTTWYEMVCTDDSNMKPQLKEFIDEVRWMDKKEVKKALKNSYRSIEEVFYKYSKDYSL
jgi:8-oxo-dGTP pyrophosphatase MutT (NUDIX family)